MRSWKLGLFALNAALVMLVAIPPAVAGGDKLVRRKIVALYHSAVTPDIRNSILHEYIQMPLNHLGLVVVYHDLSKGLPDDDVMAGARGIITCFSDRVAIPPVAYMNWLHRQMDAGRRLVMLGHPGFDPIGKLSATARKQFRRLMARIGVRWLSKYHKLTYNARVAYSDQRFMNFERPLPPVLPQFAGVQAASDDSVVLLSVSTNDIRNDVIVVGPEGGYVSTDFAILEDYQMKPALKAWYLNPFRYFRLAFATQGMPKPDITTMSGRRLYYSHIDGDGWRNLAHQAEFRKEGLNAAEVIYREIFLRYVDLPVTLGPVVGDLDPKWYGSKRNLRLARLIFRLPNVEAGNHTQSHPFQWSFFRNYKPEKEKAFLKRYPLRPGRTRAESVFKDKLDERYAPQLAKKGGLDPAHGRPRAYAVRPFNLKLEVFGSTEFVNRLLLPGKRVRLFQWSGDTSPFRAALAATARAGLRSINGGDGRMDRIFRSYAFVAPYGRWVGGLWQPYASQANENIYTPNWTGNYSAFVRLIESLRNTGRPLRVTPINVYYHLYIAERAESLASLKRVLDYVSQLEIAPVTASRFAAMSDGFVKTRFVLLGPRRWQIEAPRCD